MSCLIDEFCCRILAYDLAMKSHLDADFQICPLLFSLFVSVYGHLTLIFGSPLSALFLLFVSYKPAFGTFALFCCDNHVYK